MVGGPSSSKTAAQPSGRKKKGREKLLREVLVQVLQVSLAEGPIDRLIGAAAATKIQPVQRLALPAKPVNVKTPGDCAHIACAGASLKTAARSCHGLWERSFRGTSTHWHIKRLQTHRIAGRHKWRMEPRGARRKGGGGNTLQTRRGAAGGTGRGRIGLAVGGRQQQRQQRILHQRQRIFDGGCVGRIRGAGEQQGL